MPYVIRDNQIQESTDNEIDVEITSPTRLVGTHANAVPMFNNAQSARTFYAARFINQAMPLAHREAPLIQSLDPESPDEESFEHKYGARMGARFFNDDEGEVVVVNPDEIKIKLPDGSEKSVNLYHNFQFNRKSQLTNKPLVKPGDKVKKGQILASSNFTDDEGIMAMGVNARMALVPYKGYSMDDAIVVSESFAKRLASEHSYEHDIQKESDTKFGKTHFSSLFPTKFTKDQLEKLDENGIVKPGTVLQKGDPIILATRPKPISSNARHLGKLSRLLRSVRSDSSEVWDHDYTGIVTDSVDGRKNTKVFVAATVPMQNGDKIIAGRNGQKDITAKIIPDEQMLRSLDGTPFEVLLNPLALPSRVNTATSYEMALSKLAQKNGKPIKVPAFNKISKSRINEVLERLEKAGISDTEEVFDPVTNEKLEKPVATGLSYVYKLHHVVASKNSARGNSAYDQDEQPLKGGSEAAQAKRLGGLETTALMARGGYATLREGSTLRGQSNDDYWRLLRQGYKPAPPGTPFVWDKFKVLLNGAGMNARDIGKGVLRLAPFTERDLEERKPLEVKNGKMVDPATLESVDGGLFDPSLVSTDRWGKIPLPTVIPNPAFEKQIQQLLGITNANMRRVLAGDITLEEAQGKTSK